MPATLSPFKQAAAEAVAAALGPGVDAALFAVTAPPDAALGDLAVGVFPAAKALKAAPPALAAKVAAAFTPTARLTAAKAAGPYVNFTIDRGAFLRELFAAAQGPEGSLIPRTSGAGKTVVVDFSSPNIAKQLAYHHIRSTTLGHALVRLHAALGWKTVGLNHLGDWGTTFGMLIAAVKEWGEPEPFDIDAMGALYVRFRNQIKEDPSWEEKGRLWFKKLEDGDPTARALWQRIRDLSWTEFDAVYQLLGIHFDLVRGESAYEGDMAGVIEMLEQKGLTSISEDALVVDLSAEGMPPCLLKKTDGATLYATRDLASALYRWETFHPDRSLYVVDRGQALHFKQLFTVLRKAGYAWVDRLQHVPFGLVRIGGKKASTRAGGATKLKDVLEEAMAKVDAKVAELNPDLPPAKKAEVVRTIGVGAVVFGNLFPQRDKDVDFEIEQITSFEGDAAPYIQYAHARTASVLRKAGAAAAPEELVKADPARLALPEEWALAKLLAELPDVALRAAEHLEPHHVAHYLLDVCAAYSRWYALGNQNPALKTLTEDKDVTRARLALTHATRETLRQGLSLLGIGAPDEM